MDIHIYHANLHNNNTCHNINNCKAPAGIGYLLNLGSKFCPRQLYLNNKVIDNHVDRLTKNVRTKFLFRDDEDDSEYIQGLYYNSPNFEPPPASDEMEAGLKQYRKDLQQLHKRLS